MNRTSIVILSLSATLMVLTELITAQEPGTRNTTTTNQSTEKTVDQIARNIRVLNGMPQSQLYPTMRFMAASLGFQCGSCHVIKDGRIDASLDDKPEKQTARRMIKMVMELNKTLGEGDPVVTCYTCHRGEPFPQRAPTLPLSAPSSGPADTDESVATSPLPSTNDILNKYIAAIGGPTAADRVTSGIITGTTTTAIGQTVSYEAEQMMPDKGRETFALRDVAGRCAGDSRCEYERVINGAQGWLKSGGGVQDLTGKQLGDQKLSFPLFMILKLKDQYASFRVSGRDKIDEHAMLVLNAIRLDGKSEQLYFDVETGLLRRRISYLRSPIAMIPQQVDFQDYREVDGLKLPFGITMSYVDAGSRPIVRKFAQIKLNVTLDESKFQRPR